MERKLRFGDLVRHSGRPEVRTLWTKPEKDRPLAQAIKQNRVLTVIQGMRGRKDRGQIGFETDPRASYFIFPRPLRFKEGSVIGINYDLIEQPEGEAYLPPKPKEIKSASPPRKPPQLTFTVTVRRTATREDKAVVRAPDEETAREQALEVVRRKPFRIGGATVQEEVVETLAS